MVCTKKSGQWDFDFSDTNVRSVTEKFLQDASNETQKQMEIFCKMEKKRSFIVNRSEYMELFEKKKIEVKQKLNVQDNEHEVELRVITNILTYFDVSSNRIIESVPMIFEIVFALGLDEKLEEQLTYDLGLHGAHGPQTCRRYAQEEPINRENRRRWLAMKGKIEESLRLLNEARS